MAMAAAINVHCAANSAKNWSRPAEIGLIEFDRQEDHRPDDVVPDADGDDQPDHAQGRPQQWHDDLEDVPNVRRSRRWPPRRRALTGCS